MISPFYLYVYNFVSIWCATFIDTHTQWHHFKSVRIQGINKRNNSDLNKREENYMQSLEK